MRHGFHICVTLTTVETLSLSHSLNSEPSLSSFRNPSVVYTKSGIYLSPKVHPFIVHPTVLFCTVHFPCCTCLSPHLKPLPLIYLGQPKTDGSNVNDKVEGGRDETLVSCGEERDDMLVSGDLPSLVQ